MREKEGSESERKKKKGVRIKTRRMSKEGVLPSSFFFFFSRCVV